MDKAWGALKSHKIYSMKLKKHINLVSPAGSLMVNRQFNQNDCLISFLM